MLGGRTELLLTEGILSIFVLPLLHSYFFSLLFEMYFISYSCWVSTLYYDFVNEIKQRLMD